MSRFPRLRRRQDQWSDPHAHARMRLAERLDGPLGLAESSWLDEHVAGCPACAAIATGYEDDRLALRSLRDERPDPPRDLWARTAAAIEAESPVASRARFRRGRLGALPIGALSGLTVVALVVGVSLLSGSISIYPDTGSGVKGEDPAGDGPSLASATPGSAAVEPTPFAVGSVGPVGWIDQGPEGGHHTATVDEVCPVKGAADCPPLLASQDHAVAFNRATKTIVGSPTRRQAIAIAKSETTGDEVVVVTMPEGTDEPSAAASPPSKTPAPETPSPSSATASLAPTRSAATEPSVEPSASPTVSPEPTVAAKVAIASGIDVVGESAAYSPDGTWFAFTARPADGSGGPDVHVWRVGDEQAAKVTNDGASYFASWSGNEIIASRPSQPGSDDARPVSVMIDPATHAEADAGDLWRPVVDPTGRFAIAWDGSLARSDADGTWMPARGSLELRRWRDDGPLDAIGSKASRLAADEAAGDFDVRWDEAGEWVAVWVAETPDSQVGQLTLYRVDQANVRLERADGAPTRESALPGFSMGAGRLAWATPPGESGEGSRIQIAAWSDDGVGVAESGPGSQLVVIR